MYKFIDTTEALEGTSLPSEALKINGEYIENLIEGYRTLTVEGREALSPEITTNETGIRDGSTLKGKRYPARTIRITYQLITASSEDFRAAYNKLASILDVEDAELIFNDETDKFFIGTPSRIGEVSPGRNSVVGEFEILCLDPFKYSVMEYEAVPDVGEKSIIVDYNGTYKSYPKLEAEFCKENEASEDGETVTELTGNGECGYVAFFNEKEKIIQIGDPDEVDGVVDKKPSETLINHKFDTSSSWGNAAKSTWTVNSGITSSSAVVQAGTPGMRHTDKKVITNNKKKAQTLLTAVSKADTPYFHYEIVAEEQFRDKDEAQVWVTVKTHLENTQSYFTGSNYSVRGKLTLGGITKTFYIKSVLDGAWRGTQVHSKTLIFFLRIGNDATKLPGTFEVYREDTLGTAGTLAPTALNDFNVSTYITTEPDQYYIGASNYGEGSDWHGPSITRKVPTIAGDLVSTCYSLTYKHLMRIGPNSEDADQIGAFQVLLVNGSGSSRKIIAGVNVYKGGSGNKANLRFYVNNSVKDTVQIDLSYAGSKLSLSGSQMIQKKGAKVYFTVAGIEKIYTDTSITELPINEITFAFTSFGEKPLLEHNGISWVKFVQDQSEIYRNIPNKFSTNDVVEADCNTGEIFLNGEPKPILGALGNDWEDFCLKPGINHIGFSYSDWVDEAYAPAFKVKYREVFL